MSDFNWKLKSGTTAQVWKGIPTIMGWYCMALRVEECYDCIV